MTSRREILRALGAAALAQPFAGIAQQPERVRRIGFLGINDPTHPVAQIFRKGLTDSLGRLGYKEGKNIVIEWRYAEGKPARMAALADELVRLRVEAIMTPLNASTLAAKRATQAIPIVMITSDHPVERGLINSYARPGGNVTGLDWWPTSSLSEKAYQLLKFAVPNAKIAASIADSTDPIANLYGEEFVRRVASNVGLSIVHVQMSRAGDLAGAFDRVAEIRADVLNVAGGEIISPHYREIAAFAVKRKLASISGSPTYVEIGGLLRYGPDVFAAWDRAASYVDRILRGAKPADLPVERPTKYELVLNMNTAKAIGVKLPPAFMQLVDRKIG